MSCLIFEKSIIELLNVKKIRIELFSYEKISIELFIYEMSIIDCLALRRLVFNLIFEKILLSCLDQY